MKIINHKDEIKYFNIQIYNNYANANEYAENEI